MNYNLINIKLCINIIDDLNKISKELFIHKINIGNYQLFNQTRLEYHCN